ncbi:MAG: hypothetical protein IKU94_05245 [Bacteroidaceae bacterium]|nr:hypothetical protein [Bacteroidaceae bacterium]
MSYNSKYTGAEVEALLDSANGKQDKIEDLDTIRAGAAAGATALQEEQYKGTVTGVTFYGKVYTPDSDGKVYMGYPDVEAVKEITINGSTKTPTNGAVDLGTVLTQHQDISSKADLSNGKILASQLPDYILGQVMYGGIINSGDSSNINVQTSTNYQNKYNVSQNATINKYQFWSQTGVYFISGANGTFFDIEVKVGDWLISTGTSVAKVDNTDAVSSVAGLTGVIDASALGKELSYNDLKDKPTIPTAVTESTVSGWGFTKNAGTITGIKMNGASKGTSGVVDLGTVITSHQDISGKADKSSLAAVATSGSYNDLSDVPWEVSDDSIETGYNVNVDGELYASQLKAGGIFLFDQDTSYWSFGNSGQVPIADGEGNVRWGNVESGGTANTKPDWIENYPESDSYIKNRTHYVDGTKISSAGVYSIGLNTPIYYREKVYNLEVGVRTQIDTNAAGVYVTLHEGGILNVEDGARLLTTSPIIAISKIAPLDDIFIPEHIVREENLKTINGQSLVGSGDIAISVGGGDCDVEYIDGYSPTITPIDGKTYICSESLTFITVNLVYELPKGAVIRFQTTNDCILDMMDSLWANATYPIIEPFTWYELSIASTPQGGILSVLTPFTLSA